MPVPVFKVSMYNFQWEKAQIWSCNFNSCPHEHLCPPRTRLAHQEVLMSEASQDAPCLTSCHAVHTGSTLWLCEAQDWGCHKHSPMSAGGLALSGCSTFACSACTGHCAQQSGCPVLAGSMGFSELIGFFQPHQHRPLFLSTSSQHVVLMAGLNVIISVGVWWKLKIPLCIFKMVMSCLDGHKEVKK